MNGFIHHLVDQIPEDDIGYLVNAAYVFPTRRACYHFRDALVKRFTPQTFWLPGIFSIEDFVVKCTGKPVTSEIDLLFALYQAYSSTYLPTRDHEVDREELPTFDKFYSWGQVLLKDFDEVDRNLVNPKELYRNLELLRELEIRYQDNEEVQDALKRFNEMMGKDPTDLKANFSNQWSRISKTYHAFREAMERRNIYYPGMLYRLLAEQMEEGSADLVFDRVVFAGFNALSKSEEVIFNRLLDRGIGTVYWDADRSYMEKDVEEAGRFMRLNYRKWPPSDTSRWIITDMLKDPKKIRLIGGVQAVGQTQIVGQLMEQITIDQQDRCGIVLSDEGLLFPLLYALPDNIQKLNVTMGYPANHSHWFRLSNSFLEYQLHRRGKGDKVYVEAEYLKDLLTNPLLQRSLPAVRNILPQPGQKRRWLAFSDLLDEDMPELLIQALKPKERVEDLARALISLLMSIYQKLRLQQELDQVETEFAYQAIRLLMQLEEQIREYHQQLEARTFVRLVVQAFEQSRIPFSSEPTKGLQLMGLLETRALDFEKLILVSVNEGRVPRGNQHNTFIPYAIRKAFRLPTFEEQDAIYAYHFKRLLQRAGDATIIYNTEVAIDGSGEKSRFIWQLKQSFPAYTIEEQIYQMSIAKPKPGTSLKIHKTSQEQEMMGRFLSGNGEKFLSSTAIRHYLDCSLRFYFRYVARIKEREKQSSELDARDFGNIVHHALDRLYRPLVGETLTRDGINDLLSSQLIPEVVNESINIQLNRSAGTMLEGKDILHEQIIQKLIYKAIENDRRQTPFTLEGTETKISASLEFGPGKMVSLEGTLDRVHRKNGIVHIIDYKTGKADLPYLRKPAFPDSGTTYIEQHFVDPKWKAGFQAFFYGLLWIKNHDPMPLKLGVYPLKKVNEGIKYLNYDQSIPVSGFEEFERLLVQTLEEMFDLDTPFVQTDDADRCRYCAYKEICQR